MLKILDWTNCIGWSLAYVAAIFTGFKRRTWCIPGIAICVAFSWELLIVAFRVLHSEISGRGFLIQSIWLALDIPILFTWLWYSRNKHSLWKNILMLIGTLCLTYFLVYVTGSWAQWAFGINLLMSVAFVWRKLRDNSPWTSRWIAICKLIGTLAVTIGEGALRRNPMILWLGGLCFMVDIYYFKLLSENKQEEQK